METPRAFQETGVVYGVYFSLLGTMFLSSGMAELILALAGSPFAAGPLVLPAGAFRGGWGGLVMTGAGVMCLAGIRDAGEIHQFAKVVMGCILEWIVAATDLFALLMASIPGGEEGGWLNTWEGFVNAFRPPYTPAVLLLPFSLVVIFFIHRYRIESDPSRKSLREQGSDQG